MYVLLKKFKINFGSGSWLANAFINKVPQRISRERLLSSLSIKVKEEKL